MKYCKYILRNVLRNKLRGALTVLSLGVCLALMSILYGFLAMQDAMMPQLIRGNRVIVMSRQGFTESLPSAYLDRIRAMPGVKSAIPYSWYLGKYKDERLLFSALGTDATQFFVVWDECSISPGEMQGWLDNRQGCIADRSTAGSRGWKIGERIRIQGSNYNFDLELTLCGIYDGPDWAQGLAFHWDYLEQSLRKIESPLAGRSSFYFVKATSADAIAPLCEEIDRRYGSSESPTWSQSHQAFAQMFSKFLGNIQALVRNIGLAVVFALTLVAASTMAMSVRERTTEVAVLKAIGFRRGLILALILGESVVISAAGGLLGVAAGQGLWSLGHRVFPQFIALSRIAPAVMAYGVVLAIVIGLASGIVPAVRAAQLSVVDGLRKVV